MSYYPIVNVKFDNRPNTRAKKVIHAVKKANFLSIAKISNIAVTVGLYWYQRILRKN
jgi:hypothetical protein